VKKLKQKSLSKNQAKHLLVVAGSWLCCALGLWMWVLLL